MAVTSVNTTDPTLAEEIWLARHYSEYVRDSRFKRYMGKSSNSIIQVLMDLEKMAGTQMTVPFIPRLQGSVVLDDDTLEGNEDALDNYGDKLTIHQIRKAVRVARYELKKTKLQLLEIGRDRLKDYFAEKLRDDIIEKAMSPNLDGDTAYASSTETEKDAWLDANTDRVMFGAALSNLVDTGTADHSASLANVDSTTDTLSPAIVSLAARRARDADPHIRPVKVSEDEEWFVLFCNKWAFRDFKNHPTYQQAAREALPRGTENPLFRDGDLVWDRVILREIIEIGVVSGVGASSIDVAPNFLCGAQALAVAYGWKMEAIDDEWDYGNQRGVGISECRGVKKLFFNDKMHGMLTLYTAGVADA